MLLLMLVMLVMLMARTQRRTFDDRNQRVRSKRVNHRGCHREDEGEGERFSTQGSDERRGSWMYDLALSLSLSLTRPSNLPSTLRSVPRYRGTAPRPLSDRHTKKDPNQRMARADPASRKKISLHNVGYSLSRDL
jgi:hypothetical protein